VRTLVIVTCTLLAACGREICFPGGQAEQCATELGTVNVAAPANYEPRMVWAGSWTCLAEDGTCSRRPGFNISGSFSNSGGSFGAKITLPAREGAATYAVPWPNWEGAILEQGYFYYLSDGSEHISLIALSGTVVVEHSTTDAFRATFDVELESPDQRFHFSITGGRVEDAGCRIVPYEPYCQTAD
jgi:hypothetical protein